MYFFHDGENEVGPFSIDKLKGLLQSKMIGERTLVRSSDGDSWVPLGKLLSDLPATREITESVSANKDSVNFERKEQAFEKVQSEPENIDALALSKATEKAPEASSSNPKLVDAPSGWLASPPTPWRRYAARVLDTGLNGTIVFFIIGVVFYAIAPATADAIFSGLEGGVGGIIDIMITAAAASVLGGSLIGVSGFTLGKLIYGVKVTRIDGKNPGFLAGLSRDFSVLTNGLALGIPIVSLFTMWGSYARLRDEKFTSWDEGRYIVWHRPAGIAQYILNAVGIALTFTIFATLGILAEM